jgi:hypothetical protein
MTTPCYEIVTYKVKKPQAADSARALAQSLLKHFPGFVDWIAFSGRDMADERVDRQQKPLAINLNSPVSDLLSAICTAWGTMPLTPNKPRR